MREFELALWCLGILSALLIVGSYQSADHLQERAK
jgi:hypothetical protein